MLILHARNLSLPRVVHGFFGRQGGVSDGIYASLNCGPGSGDDRAKVIENRRRVMQTFGAERAAVYALPNPQPQGRHRHDALGDRREPAG